jgi:hypothetical protein
MTTQNLYEVIGYIASILVAISVMMNSLAKLRVINLIGAITFTTYGLLIHAYPIAIVNSIIAVTNAICLVEYYTKEECLSALKINHNTPYLENFLRLFQKDLEKWQPGFALNNDPNQEIHLVFCQNKTIGLFVVTPGPSGSVHINLGYIIPEYRDAKYCRQVYQPDSIIFSHLNCSRLTVNAAGGSHQKHLRKMGFTPDPGYARNHMMTLTH